MNEITITRALSEIATLTSRIAERTAKSRNIAVMVGATPCIWDQDQRAMLSLVDKSEKDITDIVCAEHQSLIDMIKRRANLRNAIMMSNINTTVTIGGKTMSVAAARLLKDELQAMDALGARMIEDYGKHIRAIDAHNQKIEADLLRELTDYVNSKTKEATNEGKTLSEVELATLKDEFKKNFLARRSMRLVDAINAEKTGKQYRENFADYVAEIDYTLSASNAQTTISVD